MGPGPPLSSPWGPAPPPLPFLTDPPPLQMAPELFPGVQLSPPSDPLTTSAPTPNLLDQVNEKVDVFRWVKG